MVSHFSSSLSWDVRVFRHNHISKTCSNKACLQLPTSWMAYRCFPIFKLLFILQFSVVPVNFYNKIRNSETKQVSLCEHWLVYTLPKGEKSCATIPQTIGWHSCFYRSTTFSIEHSFHQTCESWLKRSGIIVWKR